MEKAYIDNKFGRFTGPDDYKSILMVLKFVEDHLKEFSSKYSKIKNEPGLTSKLVILLNLYSKKEEVPFFFHHENIEDEKNGNSPRTDFGTISIIDSFPYSNDESFFSFEAKRLGKLDKKREKEYLTGRFENGKYLDTGGVELFKKGIHGSRLKYGAIIGYVQKYDFDHWERLINSWIEENIETKRESSTLWTDEDKLKMEYKDEIRARFRSLNYRKKDYITLFHIWVIL